jgi:hypothetical protein
MRDSILVEIHAIPRHFGRIIEEKKANFRPFPIAKRSFCPTG